MIREALGILATVSALVGLLCGFGETHPIPLVGIVLLGGWGLA